jgi:hypothetical protein
MSRRVPVEGVRHPLGRYETKRAAGHPLSSVFHDQGINNLTTMNATKNNERSLLGIDHFFIHQSATFSACHSIVSLFVATALSLILPIQPVCQSSRPVKKDRRVSSDLLDLLGSIPKEKVRPGSLLEFGRLSFNGTDPLSERPANPAAAVGTQ